MGWQVRYPLNNRGAERRGHGFRTDRGGVWRGFPPKVRFTSSVEDQACSTQEKPILRPDHTSGRPVTGAPSTPMVRPRRMIRDGHPACRLKPASPAVPAASAKEENKKNNDDKRLGIHDVKPFQYDGFGLGFSTISAFARMPSPSLGTSSGEMPRPCPAFPHCSQ
jgi:hypothetical protein